MERRVQFYDNQQATSADMNRAGEFTRDSLDHIVRDGIDHARRYTGFQVVSGGPLEVVVAAGRFYNNGRVYFRDDEGGTSIQLGDYLPLVTRRVVTIAVWGNEIDTGVEPRTFLVDPETLQTEAEAVATEKRRHAELNAVPGTENANPQAPALDANVLAVAYVTLTTSGIESIEMVAGNRLGSVAVNGQRITQLEGWRNLAGTQINTLRTDISNVASRLTATVRQEELFEVAGDVARVKRALDMTDDLTSYGHDPFLDLRDSDPDHADWLVKVEEGARFPAAQQRVANVNLLNPLEDRVKKTGDFALPMYEPAPRISILGRDGEIPISQYAQQTVEMVEKTMTRARTRYGPWMLRCQNSEWWKTGDYDPIQGIFRRDGEEWEVSDANIEHPTRNDSQGNIPKWVRYRQVFYDFIEEPYWSAVVNQETVNGAVIAQTFLNSQDGWLTHIDLPFTQVAASGNVHVLICETVNGAPDIKQVIGRVTVDHGDMKTYPEQTRVPFKPTYLKKGKRYAVVLITQGAHLVAYVEGNKFGQGTLFYSTDGSWFQGDLTRDLAMVLYYAEFKVTRTAVQIEPLELENGIANVDILAECFMPDGCDLVWEVQVNGEWRPLQYYEANILSGLPALLPARVVFLGTTDLMPGLRFGSASKVTTTRSRSDFQHISAERTMPASVNLVEVRLTLEWWEDARHDCACTLLTGGTFATVVEPDVVDTRDMPEPGVIQKRFVFELVTAIDAYKIRIDGDTDNPLITFHVAERVDTARMTT